MAAAIRELESASPEVLRELINAYYVRTHEGRLIQNESPLEFILAWLRPNLDVAIIPDSSSTQAQLKAIRTGLRFNPDQSTVQELIEAILGDRIPISTEVVTDLAQWPMQPFWSIDPWNLLQGYVRTADRAFYFTQVTGQPVENFLNETERIFYLTRGYGRPNKYISPNDLQLRQMIGSSSPTALIGLSDLLGICPNLQEPEIVLEQLSGIDLSSIDGFYQKVLARVTACLDGAQLCAQSSGGRRRTCTGDFCVYPANALEGCSPERVKCFRELLRSMGMLPIFEYDPSSNVFVSNLSQVGSYRRVIPDKKWSLDEVKNMPDAYVNGILTLLPDWELLKIEGFQPSDRLRENLVQQASQFLTQKRYFPLPEGRFGYGRRLDDQLEEMTREELEASLLQYNALIDPYEHALDLDTADEMGLNQEIVQRTRRMALDNPGYIEQLTPEQKGSLIGGFERLLREGIRLSQLEQLLQSQGPFAIQLMLWDQTPVAMDFQEYLNRWAPTLQGILKASLQYYVEVLST